MTATHPLRRRRRIARPRRHALELFYDLVFVFAITQVSHHLLEHLTWEGRASRPDAVDGLVVVELHDVADQRAGPGGHPGTAGGHRADAGQHADGHLHPGGVRRQGAAVRRRVRGHPGRSHGVPGLRGRGRGHAGAAAGQPDPDLVRGRGRVLDRRRPGRGHHPHVAVADRAGDRLRGPRRDLLGALERAGAAQRLAGRHLALRRALPAVRDHRPRRVDRDHGRHHRRAGPGHGPVRGLRAGVPVHGGAVVAVLQLRGQDRRAAPGAGGEPDADGSGRVHLPARGHDRRGDRVRRGRRARDRPPHRASAGLRGGRGGRAARPSICWAQRCSGCA